jgi:hypothetical protein
VPTTSPSATPPRHREDGSADELAWLASQHEGRLGYLSGRGQRSVVVQFAVTDNRVVIRLPEYHEAIGYASDQPVCLCVDGTSGPASHSASLEVRGRARRVDDPFDAADASDDQSESWPLGIHIHQLLLPLTEVVLVPEPGPPGS